MQQISEIHATARRYAQAGIPVFPCEVGGKKPITENGFYDATTNEMQINEWWGKADYNLAICPADCNLFVIDIDPGADLSILQKLPSTYTVKTPRGGYHLYFEGIGPTTASKIAPHIDTRSVGGYVLVPPSAVGDGVYALEEGCEEYAPLPLWVATSTHTTTAPVAAAVEDLDLPINIARARTVLQRYADKGDVAIEGMGGDDRTFRVCCEVLDFGLSTRKALMLLEEFWNPLCVPPWPQEELEQKLENAQRFRQNEVGAYAIEPPQEVFGASVRKLFPEKHSRFYFKDEIELDEEADPEWLVKDLISERSTIMMFGTSGSYKSFLALDICLSIATGKPTFGADTKKGLVFYSLLEGKAHLKKARKAWRVLKGIEGKIENFYVGRAPMVASPEEIQEFGDEIKKRCGGRMPALIVIDTLSKSMAGLNENDAQDATRFITFCDSLVEAFGCSVMAVHHASDKAEGRGARGSSAFQAGFDSVIEVKAHKVSKAVSVYVRKHKDAEERETPWTFEGRITGPSLTFEATTPEQHKALIGEEEGAVTRKTVGAALKELNVFGEEAAITTAVLATQLTPARENETVEARAEAIGRTCRILQAQAKDKLEGYCEKHGKAFSWCLPAPLVK